MSSTVSVFGAPVEPSYAAELSDSDVDDSDSDVDDDSDEEYIPPPSPILGSSTTKHSLPNAPASASLAAKRPRTSATSSSTLATQGVPTLSPPTTVSVYNTPSSSSESNESESEDGDDDDKDESTDESNDSQTSSKEDMILRYAKKYGDKIKARMRNPQEQRSGQQMVEDARLAIQYEIDTKQPWKQGIGRASSYLHMMKALLNVPKKTNMNRKRMLEVIVQTWELLEEWSGEDK